MTTNDFEPRLYVGTYAKYNAGNLLGAWANLLDFDNYQDFIEHCLAFHNDELDCELMYQDFDGFPREFYSECDASKIFEFIDFVKSSSLDYAVVLAGIECGIDLERIEAAYVGEYNSPADFAEEFTRDWYDLSSLPSFIEDHIDYERMWSSTLRFDYSEHSGFFFNNNF